MKPLLITVLILGRIVYMKVNEIFSSFQGEGLFNGVPATFLRLSECNLNCSFCDTDFEDFENMDVDIVKNIIINEMEEYNTKLLVITVGKTLLQYD